MGSKTLNSFGTVARQCQDSGLIEVVGRACEAVRPRVSEPAASRLRR
jgi:hypothetical protein